MAPLNHPEIFMCLAMVVGIYGFLYLEVARVPEKGWAIAAVGLLGKVLGPIGAIYLISMGIWPAKAFVLILTNDLIWWIPFFYIFTILIVIFHLVSMMATAKITILGNRLVSKTLQDRFGELEKLSLGDLSGRNS